MTVRYVWVRAPVEIGLSFMLKSRVEWLRDERKAKMDLCELQEIFFDTEPKEILDKLNEKKLLVIRLLTIYAGNENCEQQSYHRRGRKDLG